MQLPVENIPASTEIHIIAPFIKLNGGDWHAIDLFKAYSKTHLVHLWCPTNPHPQLLEQYPIQRISAYQGHNPHDGVLIISGARTEIGAWYGQARFDQVIMLHNLLSPGVLYQALNRLQQGFSRRIEIVYVSELVKRYAGLPGKVIHHMPSLDRFSPQPRNYDPNRFIVGRVSTDMLAKHHHSDIAIYRRLASDGTAIRIVGGTCLAQWLHAENNITLLPEVPQLEMPDIYGQLDCFYYRVPGSVKDPFPLVVLEAMMSGLPVICHRDIGTIEVIEHGVNGYIFDTPEQALTMIDKLKKNAKLRQEIGMRARLTIEN